LPCLALYGRFIAGWLPIGTDNSLLLGPNFSIRWDEGLPLWNAFYLAGSSTFDNLQFSILYPLRWPFYFVADWRNYYGLFILLHYLVSAAGVWCLLRTMRLDRLAALAGVVTFAVGGHMAGRVLNPTLLFGISWLPWIFWSALDARPRHRWGATIALAMMLAIGQPHVLFYGSLGFALVFFFFQTGLFSHPALAVPSSWRQAVERGGFFGAHLVLAAVLAAPSLLTGVERAEQSIRTRTDVATNLADSVEWNGLLNVFLGGSGGTAFLEFIDKSCFIGSIGMLLLLSIVLCRDSWRDPRFLCALALAAVGIFFALGQNVGLQYVMPYIPGYNSLVGPARALMLTAIGLAILIALAVQRLGRGEVRLDRLGQLALGGGGLLLILFLLMADRFPATSIVPMERSDWLRVWAEKPGAAGLGAFLVMDAMVGLLSAGGALLILRRRPPWAAMSLAVLLFLQLWHFSPRVFPPTRRADYYDPPPVIQTLQALRDAAPERPFRVDTHDVLRLHDNDLGTLYGLHYLMPNYATLFRLEGLGGFDPVAPLRILELVEQTAGRCPFNDRLRSLTTARPDERLYDLTGVRYLIGHPYNRRVSTLPQCLTPHEPVQTVEFWEKPEKFNLPQDFDRTQPITHWLFLAQVDSVADFPPGAQVALLHVEAREGRFTFPVRYGIETGPFQAYYLEQHTKTGGPGPVLNARWSVPTLERERDYQMDLASYRGMISFGQPLHVKRLKWEQTHPKGSNQPFLSIWAPSLPIGASGPERSLAAGFRRRKPARASLRVSPRFVSRHPGGLARRRSRNRWRGECSDG
jgi:hypothetical protein